MELKILILDDEYIILDGLCSFPWEMYGCRIVGKAMDGEEGMELIDRYQSDIILSDIKMPEKDGIQVAKYAKEKYSDTQRDPPDFQKKSGGSLFSYFKICFTDMQYFDSQIPHFHL